MKKLILSAIVAAGIFACNSSQPTEDFTLPVTNLNAWIDSVSNLGDLTAEQWAELEAQYAAASSTIDTSKLDETTKNKFMEATGRWTSFKDAYAAKLVASDTSAQANAGSSALVKDIFGDVKMANADDYSFMTADNALVIYETFYNNAKTKKDQYSSDDWNLVKAMYEKMDAQKNIVEKQGLKTADNLKIAKLKIQFATLFNIGKGDAKISEKQAN